MYRFAWDEPYLHSTGKGQREAVLRGVFVIGICEYMKLFFKWFMKGFCLPLKKCGIKVILPPRLHWGFIYGDTTIRKAICRVLKVRKPPHQKPGIEVRGSALPCRRGTLSNSLIPCAWSRIRTRALASMEYLSNVRQCERISCIISIHPHTTTTKYKLLLFFHFLKWVLESWVWLAYSSTTSNRDIGYLN